MVLNNITNSNARKHYQPYIPPHDRSQLFEIDGEILQQRDGQNNSLLIENQELKRRLAESENAEPSSEQTTSQRRAPRITDTNERNEAISLAQQFTYMHLLWLHNPFDTFRLRINPELSNLLEFTADDRINERQFHELTDLLPEKWREKMSDNLFINTFLAAMVTQRGNASTRVRLQARTSIFNCTEQDFDIRAEEFRELIGWTLLPDGKGCYKTLAPILFKNYAGKVDRHKIFRNPIIMRTYAALLRGVSPLKKAKDNAVCGPTQSHHSYERKWNIRQITPGAIAASTILARFAGSTDLAFQPIGKSTGIEYQRDYEYYLKYLNEGLQSNSPSVCSLFEEWNTIFYHHMPNVQAAQGIVDEGLDNLIRDLHDEAEQDEVEQDEVENDEVEQYDAEQDELDQLDQNTITGREGSASELGRSNHQSEEPQMPFEHPRSSSSSTNPGENMRIRNPYRYMEDQSRMRINARKRNIVRSDSEENDSENTTPNPQHKKARTSGHSRRHELEGDKTTVRRSKRTRGQQFE